MKQFKLETNRKMHTLFLLSLALVYASCDSKGQKAASEVQAPKTSIHEAAFVGNVEAMKGHIKAGTDLNVKDAYGSAPLTIVAIFNKPEIAKLLIEAGADLNVKSGDGSTPLHSAAFYCRKEITQMLVDKGADLTIRNNYGITALESVSGSFSDAKPAYDQISRDLGPLGLKLDYSYVEKTRPEIAEMIESADK